MSGITLEIDAPGLPSFQEELGRLGVVARKQTLKAMGAELRATLIEHFTAIEQDSVHHKWAAKLGAERTHFYGSAARGVQLPAVHGDDEVSVSINNVGIAQRYFGGTIEPGPGKKWLTIPAVAEAYGRPAISFNNLHFIYFRPDLAALAETMPKATETSATGVVRSKGARSERGRVVYWLKRSVRQEADPSVLPTDDEMTRRAAEAGLEAVEQLKANLGASS